MSNNRKIEKKRPFLKENEEYLLNGSTPEGLLYVKYVLNP